MSSDNVKKQALRQKATHELRELVFVFLYLALFQCALTTYSMLLLDEFHIKYFRYGAALINALVLSKIILLGESAHVGHRYEDGPLIVSAIYKAFLFGVLAAAFHVLEEVTKELLHGKDVAAAFHGVTINQVLVRNLIVFSSFIPFFAFWEIRRTLGDRKFFDLFFRKRAAAVSGAAGGIEKE